MIQECRAMHLRHATHLRALIALCSRGVQRICPFGVAAASDQSPVTGKYISRHRPNQEATLLRAQANDFGNQSLARIFMDLNYREEGALVFPNKKVSLAGWV